jgi:hypothetical protein
VGGRVDPGEEEEIADLSLVAPQIHAVSDVLEVGEVRLHVVRKESGHHPRAVVGTFHAKQRGIVDRVEGHPKLLRCHLSQLGPHLEGSVLEAAEDPGAQPPPLKADQSIPGGFAVAPHDAVGAGDPGLHEADPAMGEMLVDEGVAVSSQRPDGGAVGFENIRQHQLQAGLARDVEKRRMMRHEQHFLIGIDASRQIAEPLFLGCVQGSGMAAVEEKDRNASKHGVGVGRKLDQFTPQVRVGLVVVLIVVSWHREQRQILPEAGELLFGRRQFEPGVGIVVRVPRDTDRHAVAGSQIACQDHMSDLRDQRIDFVDQLIVETRGVGGNGRIQVNVQVGRHRQQRGVFRSRIEPVLKQQRSDVRSRGRCVAAGLLPWTGHQGSGGRFEESSAIGGH